MQKEGHGTRTVPLLQLWPEREACSPNAGKHKRTRKGGCHHFVKLGEKPVRLTHNCSARHRIPRPTMRRFLLVVLLAASCFAAPVQSTLIANIPGRTSVNLSGSWRVIVDPFANGESAGIFRDEKPRSKSDRIEYSFDASPVMSVPGDWNTQRDQLMFYEGTVWYRRLFTYQKRGDTRAFLYFGAVNYRASVYLNGQKIGEHEGGFTAFNFEVTSLLRDGENSLVVEVNDTRRPDGVPAIKFDWWNYGGITRDVTLVEVPAVFIQDYWIQLARGSQNEISGWAQLNGAQAGQKVDFEIPEAGVRQALTADAAG